MKRMKKIALFCFVFAALLILASCANEPFEYSWYIDSYTKDSVIYNKITPENKLDHFAVCTDDSAGISFNNDGTFVFKDYTGTEYKGTYTEEKGRLDISYTITLNFEDGRVATADCTDARTEALLEADIFGVQYDFLSCRYGDYTEQDFERDIKKIAEDVRDASRSEEAVTAVFDTYYYKGTIEERDGKFYLNYAHEEYDLSKAEKVFAYYIDENDNMSEKDSISSGECIVRECRNSYAVYYYSDNEVYVKETLSFSETEGLSWIDELSIYDIEEIAYVYDRGSLAPGHLQEVRIASFAECEQIIKYLKESELSYVLPENVTEIEDGAATDFLIIATEDNFYKFFIEDYYSAESHSYAAKNEFPAIADRGTQYVNIDTHFVFREIFKHGQKLSNTDVDLSYVILEKTDSYEGIDLDFTTDCTYVCDVSVNIIDARHVQYDGVLYKVIGAYDFADCFVSDESDNYSLLTIKSAATDEVLFTVKYDTGAEITAEDIFENILADESFSNMKLYSDSDASSELTSLTLNSNMTVYISKPAENK